MAADTRDRILTAALELFEAEGYERTTMRAIATRAGVSTGNAYYYFTSKADLVQAFYARLQADHAARIAPAPGLSLAERLRHAEQEWLDLIAPHHGFGTAFLSTALDPRGGSSPFSAESTKAREASIAIYRDLVAGASPAVPKAWAAVLPEALWLAHLGITLFWVTDTSPEQRRTRDLVDRAADLAGGLLRLARVPGSGAAAERLQRLVAVVLLRA
ncbi:TetR family transcriptional regulator [Alteromonas gracilis]